MRLKKQNLGFTLIELLVVITIIGLLASAAVALYDGSQAKARDSLRTNDLMVLRRAIEESYGDTLKYPAADSTFFSILNDRGYILDDGIFDVFTGTETKNDGSSGAVSYLGYAYTSNNTSGGNSQYYELSTAFEAAANVGDGLLSTSDDGSDPQRLEIGTIRILEEQIHTDIKSVTLDGSGNLTECKSTGTPIILIKSGSVSCSNT